MPVSPVRRLTRGAIIAALYAALCALSNLFALSFGPIQFRLSEALCVLPILMPEAVPGLAVGCLLSNLLSPYGLPDIIFGTLATLAAAAVTRDVAHRWTAPLPAAFFNAIVVGAVLTFQQLSGADDVFIAGFCYNAGTIFFGEAAVGYLLGLPLLHWLSRHPKLTDSE